MDSVWWPLRSFCLENNCVGVCVRLVWWALFYFQACASRHPRLASKELNRRLCTSGAVISFSKLNPDGSTEASTAAPYMWLCTRRYKYSCQFVRASSALLNGRAIIEYDYPLRYSSSVDVFQDMHHSVDRGEHLQLTCAPITWLNYLI